MPDSEWRVVKSDWPVASKAGSKTFTKKEIDEVFAKAKELQKRKKSK